MLPLPSMSKESSPPPSPLSEVDEVMDSNAQPMRLAPLASSALPSIKDLLAMDKAASSYDKKSKRKDKKSAGKGGRDEDDKEPKTKSVEAKIDRDYKRLKTYTDKKAASERS
jgi:IK cytokine